MVEFIWGTTGYCLIRNKCFPLGNRHLKICVLVAAPPSYEECILGVPPRPIKYPHEKQRGAEREEPDDPHSDDIDGYVPTYPFYPRYALRPHVRVQSQTRSHLPIIPELCPLLPPVHSTPGALE